MINFVIASILMVVAIQGCNREDERIQKNTQQNQEMTPVDQQLLLDEQMKREEDTREVNLGK